MCIIAPSLLEADGSCLGEQIKELEAGGAGYVHIDVMDGQFVPNLSFGMKLISSIRHCTELPFDVHMMVMEPIRFVESMKQAGADVLTVHYEACDDVEATLLTIKKFGMRAGIVLNPETSLEVITKKILEIVDVVQLMTVKPGIPGQIFFEESLERIAKLRRMMEEYEVVRSIEVDGGIHFGNAANVVKAGAEIIVSGKALFEGGLKENIVGLKCIAENAAINTEEGMS